MQQRKKAANGHTKKVQPVGPLSLWENESTYKQRGGAEPSLNPCVEGEEIGGKETGKKGNGVQGKIKKREVGEVKSKPNGRSKTRKQGIYITANRGGMNIR